MSNRHIARSVVVQTLFEGDMHGWIVSPTEHKEDFQHSLERNIEEFALGGKLKDFSSDLLTLTLTKRGTLDEIIAKAAPEWPL
ncbi:MAG: transcription antitermination factor NusB, partial [Minisyncoccia bacterium]